MSQKENWMSAFQPNRPNAIYNKPLAYVEGGQFGTSLGDFRVTVVDVTGDTTAQYARAVSLGFNYAILVGTNVGVRLIQEAVTKAHGYGLSIIVLNPWQLAASDPTPVIAHANVVGIISDIYGSPDPAALHELRRRAWKDGIIPVWIVLGREADARAAAEAVKAGRFKGMGVLWTGEVPGGSPLCLPDV